MQCITHCNVKNITWAFDKVSIATTIKLDVQIAKFFPLFILYVLHIASLQRIVLDNICCMYAYIYTYIRIYNIHIYVFPLQ